MRFTQRQKNVAEHYYFRFKRIARNIITGKFGVYAKSPPRNNETYDRYYQASLEAYIHTISTFRNLDDIGTYESLFIAVLHRNIRYYICNEIRAQKRKIRTLSSDSDEVIEKLEASPLLYTESYSINFHDLNIKIKRFVKNDTNKLSVLKSVFNQSAYDYLRTYQGGTKNSKTKGLREFILYVYEDVQRNKVEGWSDLGYKRFKNKLKTLLGRFHRFDEQIGHSKIGRKKKAESG